MEEFVISMGKLAGSIVSVIAFFTLVAWKPYTAWRKKEEAEKKAQKEFQQQVLDGIKSIGEDVADLQCDRLSAAHEHFMEQGYCPDTTKQTLCEMYRSYSGKGRNHLAEHYEADIMDLPSRPSSEEPLKAG